MSAEGLVAELWGHRLLPPDGRKCKKMVDKLVRHKICGGRSGVNMKSMSEKEFLGRCESGDVGLWFERVGDSDTFMEFYILIEGGRSGIVKFERVFEEVSDDLGRLKIFEGIKYLSWSVYGF